MLLTDTCPNPVAAKAAKRRAQWELERLAKIARMVEAGEMTRKEARKRGL